MQVRVHRGPVVLAAIGVSAVAVLVVLLAAWWYVLLPAAAALAVLVTVGVVATRGLVWFAPRGQDAIEGAPPGGSTPLPPQTDAGDNWQWLQ
jgi:hypothetical protein